MEIEWIIIRTHPLYSVSNMGTIKNNKTNRILRHCLRNGYPSLTLCKENTKKTYNIHTIVAEHFHQKPDDGQYVVNHKNENKEDNRADNLEYVTYRENTMYSMSSTRSKRIDTFDISDFQGIPGYEGYRISTTGDVYSVFMKRLCCPFVLPSGYHKLKLKGNDGVYHDQYIHVLMAMTYVQYLPSDRTMVINHKDGNKGNNTVVNLEIVTQQDNMKHSVIINHNKLYRKGVYYVDDYGKNIVFPSARIACEKTGVDNSSILKSCKSDTRIAGGRKWHFTANDVCAE